MYRRLNSVEDTHPVSVGCSGAESAGLRMYIVGFRSVCPLQATGHLQKVSHCD